MIVGERSRAKHFMTMASARSRPMTLYQFMDLPDTALPMDIKTAYRKLSAQYHPDVNKNQEASLKLQAIRLAYEVLHDKELRSRYDRHGLGALGPRFEELRKYLGVERSRDRGEKGGDIYTVVGLEFSESITGVCKVILVWALSSCGDCGGSGSCSPAGEDKCEVCKGLGEILRTPGGQRGVPRMAHLSVCPACGGRGATTVTYCSRCRGQGHTRVQRSLEIRIPAGVHSGSVLKIAGQGDAGKYGGPPGNLFVKLEVYNLEGFRREGDHLYSSVDVNLYDALLGALVSVPSPRGPRMLEIPPGSQDGSVVMVKGAGVARVVDGGSVEWGNQYYTLKILVPSVKEHCTEGKKVLEKLLEACRERELTGQAEGRPKFTDYLG